MGPATDDRPPRSPVTWLERSGKRWRPYLATCVHLALGPIDGHG